MARVRYGRSGETYTVEVNEGKTTQKYTQPWVVELGPDDPDPISSAEVAALAGLPRPGWSTYSPRPGKVIPFCLCKSLAPRPETNSRRLWSVTASFELTGSEQQDPQDDQADPANLAPRIEPFCDSSEATMLIDWDGKYIFDPHGDLFEEPVMAPIPLPGVRVTRYVKGFDEQTLAHWKFTTNEKAWRNQPADAWHIREVTGREVQFGNFTIGQLQFEIVSTPLEMMLPKADGSAGEELRRYGWLEVRALRSFEKIVIRDGVAKPELNRSPRGGPPKMTWIDKDGNQTTDPQYVAFRNRRRRDFSLIV